MRELFLFADLTDGQLDWIAANGDVIACAKGAAVSVEGEPAACFHILLSGTLSMVRTVRGDEVETVRSDQRGVYSGAVRFYLDDQVTQNYAATVRAVTDCEFLALPANEFAAKFRQWFPMAVHLLEGLFVGTRNANELIGQRERLLALGKLTAGLTHELNNPAAAAVRASETLRERFAGMRHKLALLADGTIDGEQLRKLTSIQEKFIERIATAESLTPIQVSDREDELGDWLDERAVPGGWDLAPVFVAAGITTDDLTDLTNAVDAGFLEPALRWLAYTVETENLLLEIKDSTTRISTLVGAAKQYSQLDRAPHQNVDLHDGLKATLVMLSGKIKPGVRLVKDFDRTLPKVPAYAAELNQVWTNLIDNALDAVAGDGTVTIRTARDGDNALVEVIDTGPGVPEELRRRVFEPFFTTKGVGQGTGLGLDVSWRVVVNRHGGDLRVVSAPGDTHFQVRLPLRAPEQAPTTPG
ncbi:MAG: cyclic nucleotide-binding domain-containing protein [Actinophytocola sp.]|uniref:ATP-binding protein n=1 Tax=Actinophytocola sp. TaxID=1872138 RepID=UPI001321F881|nr:ATP-binding protein [Actinophytocola sp.]MPZ85859.1 cyclic nucleotide-binding domain-containing protein [Actinophytocola sp.]